jgi:signal transduction histidine kinase
MLSELNNDELARMVKSQPELESLIQTIVAQNKETTSIFVHELRNPLSLLKGTIQYIELKHPEAKQFKYWNQMQCLVEDMEHMMADVSLLNTCNYLNKENIDLYELINNTVNSFMPQAISHQIELTLTVTPGCEPCFTLYNCDPLRLKQALSNLIKNAFEATNPGNYININLSSLTYENSSGKLTICISNNGVPIPEDEIETIFVPFVTYKSGGTGVGLALVNKIISLHYGTVSVASNDISTVFTITLPL